MSERPVRPGTRSPVRRPGRSAGLAGEPAAPRDRPARSHRPPAQRRTRRSSPRSPDLRYLVATLLVAVLVAASLWTSRDDIAPVAGLGLLDPGGRAGTMVASGLQVGQPAPEFRLLDTIGRPVALADLAGEPVVLQFWTSWCLVCVDAIPMFQQVANTHAGTVAVLGVAPGETTDQVQGVLDRAGATYLTLLDETGAVAAAYDASILPLTVVIDAAGTVVAMHEGQVSASRIESDLAPLLP